MLIVQKHKHLARR